MTESRDPVHFFIFAGELSGDMHGGRLIEALRTDLKDLVVTGVGGPQMRAQGISNVLAMEDFNVMGFSDVLASLPRLWKQFNRVRDHILETSPKTVIFIDSPSFSLRMAKTLRKRGFKGKIVQYISPTVWAWGKERIQQLADFFDLLLTVYPFEKPYFDQTSLHVQYVGNPIKETIRQHRYDPHWKKLFSIKESDQLIALFPGSRPAEIQRNLPKQLAAARLILEKYPETSFTVSCADKSNMPALKRILDESGLKPEQVFFIPKAYSYELMSCCRSAIAKSGTVTLELALHHCPTVVVYELSWLNRFIAQYWLRVNLPHYCIVNILGQGEIFPELIVQGFTAENLYEKLSALHEEGPVRKACIAGCVEIDTLLSAVDASKRAAQAILEMDNGLKKINRRAAEYES